jgi:hypothetical protein
MKPNIRALLDRCIREGIDHAFLNTDVEISDTASYKLADEIESRIWLYIDDYFTFTDND